MVGSDERVNQYPASTNRRWLALLLAADVCLAVIFYTRFFPKTLVAQAAAAIALVTALLKLLGLKIAEERLISSSLSADRVQRVAGAGALGLALALGLGLLRPFEVITVPGASILVDGKPYGTASATADDRAGFSVSRIYTSWEQHEFSVQKRYFVDSLGESAPRQIATWYETTVTPRIDLRMRACLGRKQGGEWPQNASHDLDTGAGVGGLAFEAVLRAVHQLARQERLPVAVECGASVTLDEQVVPEPFTAGEYLSVTLDPSIQLRVPIDVEAPLPSRVVRPARELATKLLTVLGLSSAELARRLPDTVDAQVQQLLPKADLVTVVGRLRRTYLDLNQFFDRVASNVAGSQCMPRGVAFGPERVAYVAQTAAALETLERATLDDASARTAVDGLRAVSVLAQDIGDVAAVERIDATLRRWASQPGGPAAAPAGQALLLLRHGDPFRCK